MEVPGLIMVVILSKRKSFSLLVSVYELCDHIDIHMTQTPEQKHAAKRYLQRYYSGTPVM